MLDNKRSKRSRSWFQNHFGKATTNWPSKPICRQIRLTLLTKPCGNFSSNKCPRLTFYSGHRHLRDFLLHKLGLKQNWTKTGTKRRTDSSCQPVGCSAACSFFCRVVWMILYYVSYSIPYQPAHTKRTWLRPRSYLQTSMRFPAIAFF